MPSFPVFALRVRRGSRARTWVRSVAEPRAEKPLLDARSPFSGTTNIDVEVRAQPAAYGDSILKTAAATLPPPAHWTAHRESTYAISTDDGAFNRRTIADSEWTWLSNFQNHACTVERDLMLEILPEYAEVRTRDAGPTADALFETMASRAAKGVANPHLYCWEYYLRWKVAEMRRLASVLETGGIKISGWLITNEGDGNAAQNARLSRGPGVCDYETACKSAGARGPYAFAFPVTDATDVEVYFNQIKQAATTYDVTAASGTFAGGGAVAVKATSPAPAAGVIVTIRRPCKTVQFTSTGGTTYAFTFAVSKDTDVEVRINGAELARTAFTVAAAADGYAKGGTVTLSAAPASGSTVVIRRAGYTGYLVDDYRSGSYSNTDLAARRSREYQRTTVIGRLVEMSRIMHEELRGTPPESGLYVQDGGTPKVGERWFNKIGTHQAPVLGPITTRCGSGAYQRPGADDVLASGTLWTIFDFLDYNDGEVLKYLGNGGPYPVIDTHAHHHYTLTRNFDGITFGGGILGGDAIDAKDARQFSTMKSVQYTVPATNRAGPYAFSFPVQTASAVEVWVNNVKQSGCSVTAAAGGLASGGSITFATAPAQGATVLIRAGLSQNTQMTQCPEHTAAAFRLVNAKRVAAGKPAFPGFVAYHTESGVGTTTGAATATLPPVDATVPGQTNMSQAEQVRRCGSSVGGYLVGSTWTGGWARSFVDTGVTPNVRYEPEQMIQMLRAYRWHQIVLGSLWYGESHKCTYAWTGSTATDRMNFVYNSDVFKQGGGKGDWNPNGGCYPTNPAINDSWRVSEAGTVEGVSYKVGDTITCIATSPTKWAKGVVWGAAFSETYTMQVVRKLFDHTRCDIKNGIAIVAKPRFVFGDPCATQSNDLPTWAIWTSAMPSISSATYDPPNCPCPEWNRVTFADNLLTFTAAPTYEDNRAGRQVYLRETGEHVVRVTAQVSSATGRAALILRGFDNTDILAEASAYTPVGTTSEVQLEARFTHKPHGMSGIHDPHRVGIFLRHNGVGTATFKDATIEPL